MDATPGSLNRLCLPAVAAEDPAILVECPSCKEKLCAYDMPRHLEEEMQRLKQMPGKVEAAETTATQNTDEEQQRKPWIVFKRVQRNRQCRLRQRSRRYTTPTPPPPPKDYPCPVCNERFTQHDIQSHTEECLRSSNGDENSSNDDEYGEEYEEYEWAGQKRIRVSSLLRGGYASIGVGQATNNHNSGQNNQDDDDEDLNVDEDDTEIYGPSQYGERDIIAGNGTANTDSDVTSYMRRLITEGDCGGGTANHQVLRDSEVATPCDRDDTNIPHNLESPTTMVGATTKQQKDQVIEALKAKLCHYENHVQNKFKCLICLDDYRNPAISVSCWHVHCEQCWLRSLGARKLCPQCNLITTPKDLRRIYM